MLSSAHALTGGSRRSFTFLSAPRPTDHGLKARRVVCGLNPWKTLGISESTSDEKTIKRAFRKLALKHHPDVGGVEKIKHFVDIQQAYEVLIGRSRGKEVDARGTSAGGWSFHDWYWKFATARRQKPPPRAAGGGVGAPAEHLHSQLHGLKRKAATRRRQQPASPNPEPVHAGEAPRPDPAAGHAPAGAGRRGHAYSTGPTAEEGRQKAAPSVRPVAAAPGAAAAPRSGVPRSVRVAEPPLAHAGAAPMAGHHAPDAADWRHAAAARGGEGFAGEQEGARARRSGREPMHVRSRGGMGREGFEGVIAGARRSGKGLDRAGGEGAGVLHVVRCAREFLADVRGQRLSNNVVASALQGLGARIAHAAVPATPLLSVAADAGLGREPSPAWAGAGGAAYCSSAEPYAHAAAPSRAPEARPSRRASSATPGAGGEGRLHASQLAQGGVEAAPGEGTPPSVASAERGRKAPVVCTQQHVGNPDSSDGGSPAGAAHAGAHVTSQLAGLKRRAAMRRNEG